MTTGDFFFLVVSSLRKMMWEGISDQIAKGGIAKKYKMKEFRNENIFMLCNHVIEDLEAIFS